MVQVKICGINEVAALEAAADAGADWVGFVFFAASPRFVTPAEAAALSARLSGGPGRVGLFVDPTDEALDRALSAVTLDALQIYAGRDRAAEIGRRTGLPIWHAVSVSTREDLPEAGAGIDRWLIDARPPAGATRPGGNARPVDWALLEGWRASRPWLLAGGLTPDNVAAAIRATGAHGVDVSSGVESRLGRKDVGLIRAFVAAARAAQSVVRPADVAV